MDIIYSFQNYVNTNKSVSWNFHLYLTPCIPENSFWVIPRILISSNILSDIVISFFPVLLKQVLLHHNYMDIIYPFSNYVNTNKFVSQNFHLYLTPSKSPELNGIALCRTMLQCSTMDFCKFLPLSYIHRRPLQALFIQPLF
jgi:hypothetical protein